MIGTLNLSDNFAACLVQIIAEKQKSPLAVAQTTVILPTKRACRSLKEAFIHYCENKPLLLPKMRALYEPEELADDVKPSISSMEKLFLLARLCAQKPNVDSFDKALQIAKSLSDLLDEFYLNEIDPSKLKEAVNQENLAEHWKESLEFLNILIDNWPKILAEKGLIDEKERQILLIKKLTEKIALSSKNNLYIIAGLGGEIPAVRNLIKKIGFKENVLVLLDGLNTSWEDDEENEPLTENNYQYPLFKLMKTLGIKPQQIKHLSNFETPQEALIREAFKPAHKTADWIMLKQNQAEFEKKIQNVHLIECESAVEEAQEIALILRRVLQTPEKTAALITSDRNLARRVITEMKRWGVQLDDSAGTPLNHMPTGIFLSLIAEWAKAQTGNSLLALLKHPLCADRQIPIDLRIKTRHAELHARKKHIKLEIPFQTEIVHFLRLFLKNEPVSFLDLLNMHLDIAEQLATSYDKCGIERLWKTDDGEEAYRFFAALQEYAPIIGNIVPSTYPQTLSFLMGFVSVRPKYGMHPRLEILGPIESRLTHPDVCIIGGLNEGTFPTLSDTGPWLSRLMRKNINLPSPDITYAIQGMDFAHAFCSPEVYLTRSLKEDGSQTVPSRFVSRVQAVLEAAGVKWEIQKPLLARQIDKPVSYEKIEPPAPVPPKELRPKELPVTGIKNLLSNPYAVYARYILHLYPLDKLEEFNVGASYGTALHEAFKNTDILNKIDKETLIKNILEELKKSGCSDNKLAFYRTKIEKSCSFFIEAQTQKQQNLQSTEKETEGFITLHLEDGTPFKLTAKADRIDKSNDNTYEIIDYKTGLCPKASDIESGIEPQLPLEGLILREGGFKNLPPVQQNIQLSYWHINGKETGGDIQNIEQMRKNKNSLNVDTLISEAKEGVEKLLNAYQNNTRAYQSRLKDIPYDDYEGLARVKEWLIEEDDND